MIDARPRPSLGRLVPAMEASPKEGSTRPRRSRPAPVPDPLESTYPPLGARYDLEIPRYQGRVANLATLGAQLRVARAAADLPRIAELGPRLARQLERRGIEVGLALGLLEEASEAGAPGLLPLLVEVSRRSGNGQAALEYFGAFTNGELTTDGGDGAEASFEFLVGGAVTAAQLGDADQARRALKLAQKTAEYSPDRRLKLFERIGSLGFWTPEKDEATDAYLLAAELGETLGGGSSPLDNALRALELRPSRRDVAEGVARKLVARGRSRAGDAIIRNYVKRVGAAERAAFHQRRFQTDLREGNWEAAFAAALDAGLDIELDSRRTAEVLAQKAARPSDFESFLLFLSQKDILGDREVFGQWFVSLIEAHSFLWGEDTAHGLGSRALQVLALDALESPTPVGSDARLRDLRQQLGVEQDGPRCRELRDHIARLELLRGEFLAAYEVLQPVMSGQPSGIGEAALWLFISSRATDGARAKALARMAEHLPGMAGAEMGAVASEMLALLGEGAEAIEVASDATRRATTCERALVALANAVLAFPDQATAEQIESSAALTVARAEACLGLARSALARGAPRLGLTWSERAVSLRPTDAEVHRFHLDLACRAADARRLAEGVLTTVTEFLPHDRLADGLEAGLRKLAELDRDQCAWALEKVLLHAGHVESLERVVLSLARELKVHKVEALALERQALRQGGENLGSTYLELAEARAQCLDFTAALRAFWTGLRQWDLPAIYPEFWPEVLAADLEPDAVLCKAEIEAEICLRSGQHSPERFLELGVMRWDMCEDLDGAVDAFLEAALMKPDDGFGLMSYYLTRLVGVSKTGDVLEARARAVADSGVSGALFGFASRARLAEGRLAEAVELADRALVLTPFETEVLSVLEKAAGPEDLDRLDAVYDRLAGAALGRFGERALRYRAARQMERRSGAARALRHAELAFESAPSDGVAYVLMVRLSSTLGEKERISQALERVALRARSDAERTRWLQRAAAMHRGGVESSGEELEVLFRSLVVSVERRTLGELAEVVQARLSALASDGGDESAKVAFLSDLKSKVQEAVAALNGQGAAEALALFARISCNELGDPGLAFNCISRMLEASLFVPELRGLIELAPHFRPLSAELVEVAAKVQRRCALGEQLGVDAASFLAACFAVIEQSSLEAEILVCAATDAPDDRELVQSARQASVKSGRQDLAEVVEGLLPARECVQSVLGRLGSLSDEAAIDALLGIDLAQLETDLQCEVLEVVAKREERLGRFADARDSYRELHRLVPSNGVALSGLERAAERDEDYDELLHVLSLRAELPAQSDVRRAISLRRAAILETHLGRPEQARELLRNLLADSGDSWSALRLLADSLERSSDFSGAAKLWARAQAVATDLEGALDVGLRAASAHLAAGETKEAREGLKYFDLTRLDCVELKLKIDRASADPAAVMETLMQLARMLHSDRGRAARLFLEAGEAALRLEAYDVAEECANRAAALVPDLPEARLLCCQLEVRRAPIDSKARAEKTVLALAGSEALKGSRHRELRAYLLALSRDALEGFGAGRRELERAIAEQGQRPLLAAALAGRLDDDPERALLLYEAAAGGDFLHMFSGGRILLEAAALAQERGQPNRTKAFLSAVPDGDPERPGAERMMEGLLAEEARRAKDTGDADSKVSTLPKSASSSEREAMLRLAREAESVERARVTRANRAALLPVSAAPRSGDAQVEVSEERDLVAAFEQGDIVAGQALFDIYMSERSRSRDALIVATHLAAYRPWDPEHLSYLATAASRDGNEELALSVRHVLGAYGGGDPVNAPLLDMIASEPDAVQVVLWRGLESPSIEALGLVWEHAAKLFQRDLSSYGVEGVTRLSAAAEPQLADVLRGATRLLGTGRMLQLRGAVQGGVELTTFLTSPPSLLICGRVDEVGPDLAFHLGASLAATRQELALLFGLDASAVDGIFMAIGLAFGPARVSSGQVAASVAELAGLLWQTVPPRAQRQLSQLCASGASLGSDQAFEDARIVLRRAGLLVSGSIRTAIDDASVAHGLEPPRTLTELARASERIPAVLDLLLFAISSEYAEVRYRSVGAR